MFILSHKLILLAVALTSTSMVLGMYRPPEETRRWQGGTLVDEDGNPYPQPGILDALSTEQGGYDFSESFLGFNGPAYAQSVEDQHAQRVTQAAQMQRLGQGAPAGYPIQGHGRGGGAPPPQYPNQGQGRPQQMQGGQRAPQMMQANRGRGEYDGGAGRGYAQRPYPQ